MLRITTVDAPSEITFKLEGKLAGLWVTELQRCWRESSGLYRGRRRLVDLSGVTFVDAAGKELLSTISCQGGILVGCGLVPKSLIEEIGEPQRNLNKEPRC
jgi:hypothetical protein